MADRADYKKQDKSHWPDFKHKPKSTRQNKKITARMTRRKKKQEVKEEMADREKVLKALEHHKETAVCNGCPYAEDSDTTQGYCPVYDDAIALLKEQAEIIDRYHKADTFLYVHGWRWDDA